MHAGVADAEALAGDAVDVGLAGGGAVEGDVADEDVFLRLEERALGRIDDDLGAGEALADVVVGIAFEREGHARRAEGGERLAGAAVELELDGVVRQALAAVFAGEFAAGDGADDAVDVDDRQLGADFLAALDGGLAEREQVGVVERLLEAVVLLLLADRRRLRRRRPACGRWW